MWARWIGEQRLLIVRGALLIDKINKQSNQRQLSKEIVHCAIGNSTNDTSQMSSTHWTLSPNSYGHLVAIESTSDSIHNSTATTFLQARRHCPGVLFSEENGKQHLTEQITFTQVIKISSFNSWLKIGQCHQSFDEKHIVVIPLVVSFLRRTMISEKRSIDSIICLLKSATLIVSNNFTRIKSAICLGCSFRREKKTSW